MHFTPITSNQIRSILEDACEANGSLGFKRFVEIALYHPEIGYYRSRRPRVGRQSDTDFYTATDVANAFPAVVREAALNLLAAANFNPARTSWIEIGPEPGKPLLDRQQSPFESLEIIELGEPLRIEGPAVVFSNELFDAQPFASVVFRNGAWRERYVEISEAGLRFGERFPYSDDATGAIPDLPNPAPEGYTVDLPTGARDLLSAIAEQAWTGVFLAFDYGKTWQSLAFDTPQGTARSYRSHRQNNDLLDDIGEQDITAHVCWDWLIDGLRSRKFQSINLESQESFILKRAPRFVQQTFQQQGASMGALRQLIHPALMGQKFQALHAIRTEAAFRKREASTQTSPRSRRA